MNGVRFDLRGHGLSEGKRQWIESFDDYLDDLQSVFAWCEQQLPQTHTYLHGHSLGGAICLRYAARRPNTLTGLMVNAPAFQVGTGVSRFRQLLAKKPECINAPSVAVGQSRSLGDLTRPRRN